MKIDRKISRQLAKQALVGNAIAGGSVGTQMKVEEKPEGITLHIVNPSLTEENYHLELNKGTLNLYTSYGEGRVDEEGNPHRPTAIQVFPIANMVNKEEIDAVFEDNTLKIHLPFYPNNEDPKRREIPIRSRYSNGFGF